MYTDYSTLIILKDNAVLPKQEDLGNSFKPI